MNEAAEILERNEISVERQELEVVRHPNSELKTLIPESVRKKEVFFFCDFNGDRNVAVMQMMLALNALHLASADRITLVVPYFPYQRQDRKDVARTSISAGVIIRMIELCPSVKSVITVDMHAAQLEAVFTIPVDHLPGSVLVHQWCKKHMTNDDTATLTIGGPDLGSAKRVRKLGDRIRSDVDVVLFEKERSDNGDTEILSMIGPSVQGRNCLLNDDIMDTCGSILDAAKALRDAGAKSVLISATHAEFSSTYDKDGEESTAYDKQIESDMDVFVSDSLLTESHPWLTVLPLAPFLAYTILQSVTDNGSVTKLINEGLPDE